MKNYLNLPLRKPRTKKDMAEFLKSHYGYRVWLHETRFAHNVRITHLPVFGEVERQCFETLEDPFAWQIAVEPILEEFAKSHPGYAIYSEGRSAGHLTLYGHEADRSEDYSKWTGAEVRELFNLVWDFDQACQEAVNAFVDYATFIEPEEA